MTGEQRVPPGWEKFSTRIVPIEHLDCGCIVELDNRVVIFELDTCTTHTAGRPLPDDPDYAYLRDEGEPVG